MTIEELLEMSADRLEKMTDAELTKHFEPFFKVSRPSDGDTITVDPKKISLKDKKEKGKKETKSSNKKAMLSSILKKFGNDDELRELLK